MGYGYIGTDIATTLVSILKWTYWSGHIGFMADRYIHNRYVHFYSYKMDISVWTYRLAGDMGRPICPFL
jgi:hypothetical protein